MKEPKKKKPRKYTYVLGGGKGKCEICGTTIEVGEKINVQENAETTIAGEGK